MAYYPPDVVARAREMDLLTYLQTYEPQELVKFGGNTYCTREHDSLKISNGKWCWFSRGIGGRTALDYLIKVKEIPFTEAVGMIVGQGAAVMKSYQPKSEAPKEKILLLPEASNSTSRAIRYLIGRGIDRAIIEACISDGKIYESAGKYHNVVFVGYDRYGKARYGNIRGIGSDFKGECTGSDKRFSFHLSVSGSDTVHLFESAIDLLSYATLCKMQGMDWRKDHLLSLAGVYKPKRDGGNVLPLALVQYLKDHPEIRQVVLRLDNDYAGRTAAAAIAEKLSSDYAVTARVPPKGKDYNDYLCLILGKDVTRSKGPKQER